MSAARCARCNHAKVCHRFGPCEYIERIGWKPAYGRFEKEIPCTCPGWVETGQKPAHQVNAKATTRGRR